MASETKIVITAQTAQAQAAMRTLGQSVDGVSKHMFNLSGIVGTLGGALTVTAFAGLIKSSIDAADHLNDLAQKTGIGIEALAGYKLAAEQSGTSLESVARGIKNMSIYMVDHADKLKKLGVTATDSNGAMVQIADVFTKLPDGVVKSKLAVDVFGKAAMDMIPMLNLGSQGLAEAQGKAAEYGRRMKELAPDADKFNDQLAELSLQSSGLGIQFASIMLPALNDTATAMNNLVKEGHPVLALWRGLAGMGKIPWDFLIPPENLSKSLSSANRIKELKSELAGIEENLKITGGRGGLVGKLLHGSREEQLAQANILKNQIAALEKFGAQIDKKPDTIASSARTPQQVADEIKKQRAFDEEVRKIIGDVGKNKKTDPFKLENEAWVREKEFQIAEQKRFADELDKINGEMRSSALAAQQIFADVDPIYKASLAWEEYMVLVEAGYLDLETAGKHYAKTFGESTDQMTQFAKRAGENIQDAFAEFLFDPFQGGVQGMLDGFTVMLRKMAAEALASQVLGSVGAWGKTGGGAGSVLGDIAGAVFGSGAGSSYSSVAPGALSFAGGGFTGSGSRSGGIDGRGGFPAILHPNETVIDHARGQNASQAVIVNNYFTLSQPADRRTQEQIAAMAGASIQNAMLRGA